MKNFSVCYDKYCIGKYDLVCNENDEVQTDKNLGAFEMYILGMWNDGMVVTMKGYDKVKDQSYFMLLLPDGSEQVMTYLPGGGFDVKPFRETGLGRFAYLLAYGRGLYYRGFVGYEEYDEEEGLIMGTVRVNNESLTYYGSNFTETRKEFERVIESKLDIES